MSAVTLKTVQVVLQRGVLQRFDTIALDRKVCRAAGIAVLREFGQTKAADEAFLVEVREFREAPPHELLFKRVFERGVLREVQ